MHRFRGNVWDYDSRPQVMQTLGYPLEMTDRIPKITEARNIELGLGLQVALLLPLILLPFALSHTQCNAYLFKFVMVCFGHAFFS